MNLALVQLLLLGIIFSLMPGMSPAQSDFPGDLTLQKAREAKANKDPETMARLVRQGLTEEFSDSAAARRLELFRMQAAYLYNQGKLRQMIDTVRVAMNEPGAKPPEFAAPLLRLQATGFLMLQQRDSALPVIEKAISMAEKMETIGAEYQAYNLRGVILFGMGNTGEALQSFITYKNLVEDAGNEDELAMALLNIGVMHQQVGDKAQAKKAMLECLAIRKKQGESEDLAIAYATIGQFYQKNNQLEPARMYVDSSLAISRKIGDDAGLAIELGYLGNILTDQGKYEEAIEVVREKIRVEDKVGLIKEYAMNYTSIGELKGKLGEVDSAEWYLNQSLEFARKEDRPRNEEMALQALFEVQKTNGDFERALATHETLMEVVRRIYEGRSDEELAKARAEYKTGEVEDELENVSEEKDSLEKANTIYVILLIALAALLAVVFILWLQLRRIRQKLEVQNDQLTALVATKNKFFSIIAHDLRSPLVAFQSIGKRVLKAHQNNDSEKLERLANQLDQSATQLNGLLNNLLNWALMENELIQHRPQDLPLQDVVLDNIDLYQDLANLKSIDLKVQVPPGMVIHADENALNLMLRNLLSNAIKFTEEGGLVEVIAAQANGKNCIEVRDSGIGIPEEKRKAIFNLDSGSSPGTKGEKGTGLGLHLVAGLMEQHGGKANVIPNSPHGCIFRIEFPAT